MHKGNLPIISKISEADSAKFHKIGSLEERQYC